MGLVFARPGCEPTPRDPHGIGLCLVKPRVMASPASEVAAATGDLGNVRINPWKNIKKKKKTMENQPKKMAMFHCYVNVYQRVRGDPNA